MYNPFNPLRSSIGRQNSSRGDGRRTWRSRNFICCFCTVFTILLIVVIAALVIKLVIQPRNGKVEITEAILSQFNFTAPNTLSYNLSLVVQFRNPNKHMTIDYKRVLIIARYEKQAFSNVTLAPFHQDRKHTTSFEAVFVGQSWVLLTDSELSRYKADEISGVYGIGVKMELQVTLSAGKLYIRLDEPTVYCDLTVPLIIVSGGVMNNSNYNQFQDTKCRWDSRKYDDYY